MKPREKILVRIAMGDDAADLDGVERSGFDLRCVDSRDRALVRLGAMLALDAPTSSLQRAVSDAQLAGVSDDEIVRCLVSLVTTLGSARASSVAPHLALAMGFDLDQALEER